VLIPFKTPNFRDLKLVNFKDSHDLKCKWNLANQ